MSHITVTTVVSFPSTAEESVEGCWVVSKSRCAAAERGCQCFSHHAESEREGGWDEKAPSRCQSARGPRGQLQDETRKPQLESRERVEWIRWREREASGVGRPRSIFSTLAAELMDCGRSGSIPNQGATRVPGRRAATAPTRQFLKDPPPFFPPLATWNIRVGLCQGEPRALQDGRRLPPTQDKLQR